MPRKAANSQRQIRGRRQGVMKKANDIYEMYGHRYLIYIEDSDGRHIYKSHENWLPDIRLPANIYLPSNFMTHAEAIRNAESGPQITPSAVSEASQPASNPYAVGSFLPGTTFSPPNSNPVTSSTSVPPFSVPSVTAKPSVQPPNRRKTRAETRRLTLTEKGDVYGFQKLEQDDDMLLMSSLEEFQHNT